DESGFRRDTHRRATSRLVDPDRGDARAMDHLEYGNFAESPANHRGAAYPSVGRRQTVVLGPALCCISVGDTGCAVLAEFALGTTPRRSTPAFVARSGLDRFVGSKRG